MAGKMTWLALVWALLGASAAFAQDGEGPGDEGGGGIKDNSFFVEEAYNQEAGVVQHIFTFLRTWDHTDGRARTFEAAFTQEWPITGQDHQFSYTLPFSHEYEAPAGGPGVDEEGFGDMLLNYRYQLNNGENGLPAIAPRFSLILPTGDEDEGLGTGEVGYQFNLPISHEFGCWATHFNAGATVTPNADIVLPSATTSSRYTLNGYNLGASLIAIHSDTVQPLVEWVAVWDEEIDDAGAIDHTLEMLVSPGVRWAPYTNGERQVVVGAAVPIGLTRDSFDLGMFFYLSIEHPFCE